MLSSDVDVASKKTLPTQPILVVFDSPSLWFSLRISIHFPRLCLLLPIHPLASSLLARWFVYHRDGCRIKVTLFFYLHRSFSASLLGLILVSSHCEVLNASYHMAAGSGRRCRGAFIGASERSCNNSCWGLIEFVMTLMLDRADPSRSLASPHPPTSPNPLNSFRLLFYTKPQIGSGIFTGRWQSPTTK